MSHLQEMVKKISFPEGLSTSGGALRQLFMSASTYAHKTTEQSGRFIGQTFLPIGFPAFPLLGISRDGLRLWL